VAAFKISEGYVHSFAKTPKPVFSFFVNCQQQPKQIEYNRHMIKIIIDMDDQSYGFPAIRFWPKPPITLRWMPYYFQFHVQQSGKQHHIGEITIG
jgi:hypothetical protein